jgi:hypothetical protein
MIRRRNIRCVGAYLSIMKVVRIVIATPGNRPEDKREVSSREAATTNTGISTSVFTFICYEHEVTKKQDFALTWFHRSLSYSPLLHSFRQRVFQKLFGLQIHRLDYLSSRFFLRSQVWRPVLDHCPKRRRCLSPLSILQRQILRKMHRCLSSLLILQRSTLRIRYFHHL